MRYLLYSILAGALMGLSGQQTTPEAPAPPPAEEEPSPPPSPESTETPESSQEDELSPFTPSEKVPADSAISFPVDI